MDPQNMNMNIDLKNTQAIEPKNGKVWSQGFILRKVSKFVVGAEEDAVLPIPVFYDTVSGKILESTIPLELREEYKEYSI